VSGECPEGLLRSNYYDFYAAFGWENFTDIGSISDIFGGLREPESPSSNFELIRIGT
jgi:hypothetical protein